MNQPSPFGAHKDVLDAPVPDTDEGRQTLLEELKRRGRLAVQASDWPSSRALYQKALDCCPDKAAQAVLQANLALVHGKMNAWSDSQTAARHATRLDASYVKGWWRLGQACAALHDYDEAVAALKRAQTLEPNNKALTKELTKIQKQQVDYDAKKLAQAEKENAKAETTTTTTTTMVKEKKEKKSTGPEPMPVDDETSFTPSEHVKGYKIVNGKKTSYFHNELSQEAAALIGDIAPKKLESTTEADSSDNKDGTTSAWNKAGTWEEKDVTAWGQESLQTALQAVSYTLPASSPAPGAVVTTTKATVTGHASVATVRGKKRYIYEWLVKLQWEFAHEAEDAHGTLNFPDVDGTVEVGTAYDATDFVVTDCSEATLRPLLEAFVHKQGWRDALHACLDDWVRLFQATY